MRDIVWLDPEEVLAADRLSVGERRKAHLECGRPSHMACDRVFPRPLVLRHSRSCRRLIVAYRGSRARLCQAHSGVVYRIVNAWPSSSRRRQSVSWVLPRPCSSETVGRLAIPWTAACSDPEPCRQCASGTMEQVFQFPWTDRSMRVGLEPPELLVKREVEQFPAVSAPALCSFAVAIGREAWAKSTCMSAPKTRAAFSASLFPSRS